jgi:hypothetical protein
MNATATSEAAESKADLFRRLSALVPPKVTNAYWKGYVLGLGHWYHGDQWGDQDLFYWLADYDGAKGQGYRDGSNCLEPRPQLPQPVVPTKKARRRSVQI